MAYCWKCGIELEASKNRCAICHVDIPIEIEKSDSFYPRPVTPKLLDQKQKRNLFWRIASLFLASCFIFALSITLTLDDIFWGPYLMSSTVLLWLLLTLIIYVFKKQILFIPAMAIVFTGYLVTQDLLDGKMDWFLTLGLPIVGIFTVYLGINSFAHFKLKLRLVTELALNAIYLTIISIGLELLISSYLGETKMLWSFIIMAVLLPLSIFLFYIAFSLSKRVDLGKIFHI